jgi:2-polyprenyl-3-methyl-5-hydroxy-6-metoxy-1,4-benzoquinol methylase
VLSGCYQQRSAGYILNFDMKKSKADEENGEKSKKLSCWCGCPELEQFSDSYHRCSNCQTLVSTVLGKYDRAALDKKQVEFYGKPYWLDYQKNKLGFPTIDERARQDLSGRCLYWLKTILKYRLPDARLLELGSAHGGFVSLLNWTGYRATGLEINKWVIDFARRAYNVDLLEGSLEAQYLPKSSLDIIVLMDVIEHVADPLDLLSRCAELLTDDGIIVMQTPQYPEGTDYTQLQAAGSPFLNHLHENEHFYLFSRQAVVKLLQQLNLVQIVFEPAFFAHYDMFLVAGKKNLLTNSAEKIERALSKRPEGRMVLALCELDDRLRDANNKLEEIEKDSRSRFEQIEQLNAWLKESDVDRTARFEQIEKLTALLRESEVDRAARFEQIEKLTERVKEVEAESNARLLQVQQLEGLLKKKEVFFKRR